ncbi:MAG: hypothetical protein WAU90_08520, partial [Methyloceanibacter sp.]
TGSTPKQITDKVFACVSNITCNGGTVKDGKCVCPKGWTVTTTGNNVFACVKPSTGGASEGSTGGTPGGSTTGSPPTFVAPQGLLRR